MKRFLVFSFLFLVFGSLVLFSIARKGTSVKAYTKDSISLSTGLTGPITLTPTATIGLTNPTFAPTITIGPTNPPTIIPTITPTLTPTIVPSPTPTPDSQLPSITIAYPLDGSKVNKSSTVTITALAFDNVGISRVDFFVNNSLLCSDNLSPYQCNWYVPKKPGVKYNIVGTAYDLVGNFSSDLNTVTSK